MWPDNVKKVRSIQYPPTENEDENGDKEQYLNLAMLAGYYFLISFDMMFSASLFAVYVNFKCCLMLILYWVICLSLSTCFMMFIHLLVSLTSICIIDLNQQRYSDIISLIRMRLRFELLRTCLIALRGYQARKAENKNTFISEFHLILFKWSKTWLFCGKGCISSQ